MKRNKLIQQARKLVFSNYYGVLATQGKYPFASLIRYSPDSQGLPVLLLSRIAEHTKNLANSNKVSLLVLDTPEKNNPAINIQECARMTLMGTLTMLQTGIDEYDECLQTHFAFFPETRDYHRQLDFDVYRLQVESCRYVGGFAAAHTLSANDYMEINPLSWSERKAIMAHMNEDHRDAMVHYCETLSIPLNGHTPELVALDRFGFQLRTGKQVVRLSFPHEVTDRSTARDAFVTMARTGS
jgi:heme iron utilization protein